jgi:hypothetical protein
VQLVVVCQDSRKRAFVGFAVGRRDTVAAWQVMRYACMDFVMPALGHPSCLNTLLRSVCAAGTAAVAAGYSSNRGVLLGVSLAHSSDRSCRSWLEVELAEVDRRSIAAAGCWFGHSCSAALRQDESTDSAVCMSLSAPQRVCHNFPTDRSSIVETPVQRLEYDLVLQESDRSVCWQPDQLQDCAKSCCSAGQ